MLNKLSKEEKYMYILCKSDVYEIHYRIVIKKY